jgi:hypothetical protein
MLSWTSLCSLSGVDPQEFPLVSVGSFSVSFAGGGDSLLQVA